MLWAYRNIPHDTTGEKPSFLLFDIDCRTPALLPPADSEPTNDFTDYRQELVHTLSFARLEAATNLGNAQRRYKSQHDKNVHDIELKIGVWVLVYFPKEDSGKNRN